MYTEGYAKRLTRLDLYLHVQRRLSKPARAGAVVVLPGPSAGEIGVVRHILSELQSARTQRFKLPMERDVHWDPKITLAEAQSGEVR